MTHVYPRPLPKRRHGSRKERIEAALREELADGETTTLRFLYYRLIARGIIEKCESFGYHQTSQVLVELREAQVIPMSQVVDRTSGALDRAGTTLNVHEWTRRAVEQFRLDRWPDQPTPQPGDELARRHSLV